MKQVIFAVLACGLLFIGAAAQKKLKPWTEWTLKEAEQILDDSAWGQIQREANTSEMFYNPNGNSADRNARGATNQVVTVNYRIRLLSAKPIRQAFARTILLQQKAPNAQLEKSLHAFIEQPPADRIIIAVSYDSVDRRFSGPAMQAFNSTTTALLQNNTFLETKGGKRVFLKEYHAPTNDGLGARFAFPRVLDGQPFVKPDGGNLRFYTELSKDIKLNMRFKIAELMYDGQLEY